MRTSDRKKFLLIGLVLFAALILWRQMDQLQDRHSSSKKIRIYWFVPDGLRADPKVFRIYDWAEAGELPNLKKLMSEGAYGYSVPVFPSHTPVNFATLMTGSHPLQHGVTDGLIKEHGYPLSYSVKSGFNSSSKRVSSIWDYLESQNYPAGLLSVPGSTPPTTSQGTTIRGRWGGWSVDFVPVIFNSDESPEAARHFAPEEHAMFESKNLVSYVSAEKPQGWALEIQNLQSYSEPFELNLENWGLSLYAFVLDTSDDQATNYDRIVFSFDKKSVLAIVDEGQWSEWLNARLSWKTKTDYNLFNPQKSDWENQLSLLEIPTVIKIRVIQLKGKKTFRIRFIYNNLLPQTVNPPRVAERMFKALGPMVDFPDHFPLQLVQMPEDKQAFLEELQMSLKWHQSAVHFLTKETNSEVVVHSIYSPNQMLTSRWWMPYLDPQSSLYKSISESERQKLWQEVKGMYSEIDSILGEILRNRDEETFILFGSDHGIVPLDKEVQLNNYFEKKGWLKKIHMDELGGEVIDWRNTKVAFIRHMNIYINPQGLDGPYRRASGPAYEQLRREVIKALQQLKDEETQASPVAKIWKWEEASDLNLPQDRLGDLIIANHPLYEATDTINEKEIFKKSLVGGHKQAVLPETEGLLTPFVFSGPGIKKNYSLSLPISHVDQYATILKALNMTKPSAMQSKPINEIFESPKGD